MRAKVNSTASAKPVASKTTTTDARIINQVKAAVISQVKFSKSPGSSPVQMFYTVKLDGK